MSNESRVTSRPAEVCEDRATTWDAKRASALRVAPRLPRGFVVRPSQAAAGRLRPHALPRGILGATQHQQFVRHDTSPRHEHRTSQHDQPDAMEDFPSHARHLGRARPTRIPMARLVSGRIHSSRRILILKTALKRASRQGNGRPIKAKGPGGIHPTPHPAGEVGMGWPGLQAGCSHPAETWQSRLGSGWITSSGRMLLPLCPRDARSAASLPPREGTRPTTHCQSPS